MEKYFIDALKRNNVVLNDNQLAQFAIYADTLISYNEKVNLTAIVDREEIYVKHFLDSILPSFVYKIDGNICDVGAGAGFPSIPLKIIYPDIEVTIVEPIGKRVEFLKELCKKLEIDVNIVNARAEDFAKDYRESFDNVTARAVANLQILSELCIPLVKVGGQFIVLKGNKGEEELNLARNAITKLGGKVTDINNQHLIDDIQRVNILITKVSKTQLTYPRNYSKIKSKPL